MAEKCDFCSLPQHEIVPQIVSEVVELEPQISAIAVVMVMKDGDITTRMCFLEGQKFALIAGVTAFQNDMLDFMRKD